MVRSRNKGSEWRDSMLENAYFALFGNFLLNYRDAIVGLIMCATWFDLHCTPTWVRGHFDARKYKQASAFWSWFTFVGTKMLANASSPAGQI